MVEEVRPLVTALVNVNPDSKTSLLMKDKMSKVSTLAVDTQTLYDERLKALELALDAGEKFWTGLDELKLILKDVQDHLDSEELPAADLEVLEEQIHDHQVRNESCSISCLDTVAELALSALWLGVREPLIDRD